MTRLSIQQEVWQRFTRSCEERGKDPHREAEHALLSYAGDERALKRKNAALLRLIAATIGPGDTPSTQRPGVTVGRTPARKRSDAVSIDALREGWRARKERERAELRRQLRQSL